MLPDHRVRSPHSSRRLVVSIASVLFGVSFGVTIRAQAQSVFTQHNDPGRTGAYLTEMRLTPAVLHDSLHLLYVRPTSNGTPHEEVTSQILYARAVPVDGEGCHGSPRARGTRNVMFATTRNNTVYAYDADNTAGSGRPEGCIWKTTLPEVDDLRRAARRGILGTPVIDPETSSMYVVFGIGASTDPNETEVEYRIAALDIRTGRVVRQMPIAARFISPRGVVAVFHSWHQRQRAGLLLTADPVRPGRKVVYAAFGAGGSWEENSIYQGWVMGFDAQTLALVRVFCTAPDRVGPSEGAGIWQGGAGLVSDVAGNVYFLTGNGITNPGYGNHAIKLTPLATGFAVSGFDAKADDPLHGREYEQNDIDLGSGGLTLIPGTAHLVGGGKTGILYLLNAADPKRLIKLDSYPAFRNAYTTDSGEQENRRWGRFFTTGATPFQNGWHGGPHLHGAPTYWHVDKERGYLFHWAETDFLRRFTYNYRTGRIDWSTGRAGTVRADNCGRPGIRTLLGHCPMPAGMTSLSANGATNGIVWATLPRATKTTEDGDGEVLAFDAQTLNVAWSRRLPGVSVARFAPPTVADGKVFVGTRGHGIYVFGLVNTTWLLREPLCPAPCTLAVIKDPRSGGYVPITDFLNPDYCPICMTAIATFGRIRDMTVNENGMVKELVTDGTLRAFDALGKEIPPSIPAKAGIKDGLFAGCPQCSGAIKSGGILRGVVLEQGRLRHLLVDFTSGAKSPAALTSVGPS